MADPIRVEAVSRTVYHVTLTSPAAVRVIGAPRVMADALAAVFRGVSVQDAPGQPDAFLVRLSPDAVPSGCFAVDAIHAALAIQLARPNPLPSDPE